MRPPYAEVLVSILYHMGHSGASVAGGMPVKWYSLVSLTVVGFGLGGLDMQARRVVEVPLDIVTL